MEKNDLRLLLLAFLLGKGDIDGPYSEEFLYRLLKDKDFLNTKEVDYFIDELFFRRKEYSRRLPELEKSFFQTQEYVTSLESKVQGVQEELVRVKNNLEELNEDNSYLAYKTDDISNELHEYIWKSSIGIQFDNAELQRFIPIRIYLSETPKNYQITYSIKKAIENFWKEFGFIPAYDYPDQTGSWWKKFWFKTIEAVTKKEVKERLDKAERAIELNFLDKPQSEANKNQAEAAACLINSISNTPNACIQSGSLLVVKVTKDGQASIMSKTLTLKELRHLEENQSLIKNPNMIFDWLQEANTKQIEE